MRLDRHRAGGFRHLNDGPCPFRRLPFGAVSLAGFAAQAAGLALPSQLLASLPYIVTIVVLGVISSNRRLLKINGVASLGEPFEP